MDTATRGTGRQARTDRQERGRPATRPRGGGEVEAEAIGEYSRRLATRPRGGGSRAGAAQPAAARLPIAAGLLAASTLLAAPAARAQPGGSIAGSVADAGGGALPGVTVAVTGDLLPAGRLAVTGLDGGFVIDALPAAEYVVRFALPGFETREVPAAVGGGATVSLDVVLELERLIESVSVIADEPTVFATNVVAEPMLEQQAAITSVVAVVDNLPGVSVQEGDTYGFDDWSSSVAVRGFQTNINEAQIGTTIDGFPNGTSDYWSGAKANRFVDPANLGGVEVSQGTADVASRSVEALGGTFNFLTDAPETERTYNASVTLGENAGERYHMRVDTGALFDRETYAWLSAGRQTATDWVQGAAQNEREHIAAKVASSHGRLELTSYFSYDQINEDVYQRIYSAADFAAAPRWDRLLGDWPGVPYLSQFYRRGWTTHRKNAFTYLKADWAFHDAATLSAGAYYHRNRGHGEWLPPYVVDVTDDGGGPESELKGEPPVRGGAILGQIHFVDHDLQAVAPRPGCRSSYLFHYYGAGGPEVDPACHPGATAVQSLRHSHYGKDRFGFTLDEEWTTAVGAAGNTLRAGLWFEDTTRILARDWHRVLDPSVDVAFDETPYWQQYDWDFPQQIFKWYAEDTVYAGPLAISGGVKQFLVGVSRRDLFGVEPGLAVDSDSDLLLSGGVTLETPVDGFELFAGYAENFKSLADRLLEVPGRSLAALEPETAANVDVGMRYSGDRVALGAAWYDIDFDNRIFFLGPTTTAGPDYLLPGGGAYFNAGGIDTSGVELSATVQLPGRTSFYTAWTLNDSEYVGTGDAQVDAAQNIRPGSAVTGVPDRLWVLSLDRTGPLGMGISAKYTSARRISLVTDWHADAYWLTDAYLTFSVESLTDRFGAAQVSLVANNLFDASYLAAIVENAAWLGAPRTISMNMSVSF